MDRQQAINILKNTGYIGNEVGVAFDVAIKSMDKLEQIEQIVKGVKIDKTITKALAFNKIKEVLDE